MTGGRCTVCSGQHQHLALCVGAVCASVHIGVPLCRSKQGAARQRPGWHCFCQKDTLRAALPMLLHRSCTLRCRLCPMLGCGRCHASPGWRCPRLCIVPIVPLCQAPGFQAPCHLVTGTPLTGMQHLLAGAQRLHVLQAHAQVGCRSLSSTWPCVRQCPTPSVEQYLCLSADSNGKGHHTLRCAGRWRRCSRCARCGMCRCRAPVRGGPPPGPRPAASRTPTCGCAPDVVPSWREAAEAQCRERRERVRVRSRLGRRCCWRGDLRARPGRQGGICGVWGAEEMQRLPWPEVLLAAAPAHLCWLSAGCDLLRGASGRHA